MTSIPTLETERLVLRPFCEGDLDVYASMLADAEVVRYLGDGRTCDREEAWRRLAMLLGHWELRGYGMWAVAERARPDRMLGRAGFYFPEGWPGFEIGWTFARSAWGRGYATESARRALEFGFAELGRDEVISVIHPDNAASIRVAERIGERFKGHASVRGEDRLVYCVRKSLAGR